MITTGGRAYVVAIKFSAYLKTFADVDIAVSLTKNIFFLHTTFQYLTNNFVLLTHSTARMKSSRAVLSIPRRLAGDVLRSAENSQTERNKFFAQMPGVLQRFFEKYPPPPYGRYADKPTWTNAPDANPFLANKHPITQSWHKPKYSMRRQADLWKAAYRFGIDHLMPTLMHGKKFYEQRYESRPPVRGAQFFKLKKGERIAPQREKEVMEAILQADSKIAERKGKRFQNFLQNKDKTSYV